MRLLDPYAYPTLALFIVWDFGRRVFEWLMTGQLRVSSFGNLDHYAVFSQEPVYYVFGFFTMSVLTMIGLICAVALMVED